MIMNAKQEWAIKKMLRIRDLEIQNYNGPHGEVYVKSTYDDKTTELFYRIKKTGAIDLMKETHHIEMVWKHPEKSKGRGVYIETVLAEGC